MYRVSVLLSKIGDLELHNEIAILYGKVGNIRLCLHDPVFILYRIGFISDGPCVYTRPFSFHIG